jgi:hypothetical protein
LAAGVYLSVAPDPPPPVTHSMNTYACIYSHREVKVGGGEVCEPVRRLEER